jgi:hypothetical protein
MGSVLLPIFILFSLAPLQALWGIEFSLMLHLRSNVDNTLSTTGENTLLAKYFVGNLEGLWLEGH